MLEMEYETFSKSISEAVQIGRKQEREITLEIIDRVLLEQDNSPAIIVKTIQYLRQRIEQS